MGNYTYYADFVKKDASKQKTALLRKRFCTVLYKIK